MTKGRGWGYVVSTEASGFMDRTPIGNARKRGVPFYILKTMRMELLFTEMGNTGEGPGLGETVGGGVSLGLF